MKTVAPYRRDIDGLRAIAVLMVLIFHFELLGPRGAGFLGVDVFFVISGFLITSIICSQIADGTFNLLQFYLNRVRRLAPALFATLLLVMLAGHIWLFPNELIDLSKQVTAAQLYVSNFYYWRTINYFGLIASNAYLLHTWSLAVEEQFYLLYPLALLIFYRLAKTRFWLLIGALFALSFVLNIYFLSRKPEATFYLLPTRAWELLMGALLVYASQKISVTKSLGNIIGVAGLLLIAASFALLDKTYRFPGFAALIPTIGAALVILAGNANTLSSLVLSNSLAAYVGRISYPLYLVHWPINVFCSQIFRNQYTLSWRFVMFFASVGVASAIYHLVEKPIRNGHVLSRRTSVAASYFAGISVSLFACALIYQSAGLPQRFSPEVRAVFAFSDDRPPEMAACEFAGGVLDATVKLCRVGAIDVSPTWMIFGDSHAWAAFGAFDKWLKQIGQSGVFIFSHQCPPIEGVHLYHDLGRCAAFSDAVYSFLKRTAKIDKVFLVSIWLQAIGELAESEELPPTPEGSVRLFEDLMTKSIEDLHAAGKQVFIWEPLPAANGFVPQALARAAVGYPVTNLALTKDQYLKTFGFFFDTLAQNQDRIAGRFSPSLILCRTAICAVTLNDKPIYFDGNHLTWSSSSFWAAQLEDQLPNAAKLHGE